MALGRFKEVSQQFLNGHADQVRSEIDAALTQDDPSATVSATRRHQIILSESGNVYAALGQIQDAFARMGFGLDPISVEDLIEKPKALTDNPLDIPVAVEIPLGEEVVVEQEAVAPYEPDPFVLVERDGLFDDDPVELPALFADVASEPVATIHREEQMIRAVFGLQVSKDGLMHRDFAHAVEAVFAGEIPPKNTPGAFEKFGEALRITGGFIEGLLRDLETNKVDPFALSEDRLKWVNYLTEFLASEGYPDDVSSDVLWKISHRKKPTKNFLNEVFRGNKPTEVIGIGENGSTLIVDLASSDKPVDRPAPLPRPASMPAPTPRSGMFGLKPVSGKDYVIATPARVGAQDQGVILPEKVEVNKRILDAILGINDVKEPSHAGLRDIALSLIGSQVADLPTDARDGKVDGYVTRVITPFIAERVRAVAMVAQKGAGNVNLQQRLQANELIRALIKNGYPDDLSPSEIGQIMSRQTTLQALIARKESASISAVAGSEPNDKGGAAPVEKPRYKKVDRLNEKQSRYLDIVYATTDAGEIKYPTREDALRAMYGATYDEAVYRGDKKAIGLMKAHFARTGHALAKMIHEAQSRGHAPAELRAKLQEIKNLPAFSGYDNSLFLQLAVRL